MKLLVLGATGRTGRLVVEQGACRRHAVTALVRGPGMLPARDNVDVVVGDPLRAADLEAVLPGHDAVISCLGQRSQKDAGLLCNAARAVLDVMPRCGVRRYLVVSQGLLFPSRNPIVALLRLSLARHVADTTEMENVVRASSVDWTIVRPPRLTGSGEARGYRAAGGALPSGAWAMRCTDLADFLLDECEKPDYIKAIVGVASR